MVPPIVKQYARTLIRPGALTALRTDPQCVVVVGELAQLDDQQKLDAFEQYRRELRNVQVLTFDEVKTRAQGILALLTTSAASDESPVSASSEFDGL